MRIDGWALMARHLTERRGLTPEEAAQRIEKMKAEATASSQVVPPPLTKRNPWTDLQERAKGLPVPRIERGATSFSDPVLEAALEKSVGQLIGQTSLDGDRARRFLLARARRNKVARRTASSLVSFLKYADASWITECPECGNDHGEPFARCTRCGALSEEGDELA